MLGAIGSKVSQGCWKRLDLTDDEKRRNGLGGDSYQGFVVIIRKIKRQQEKILRVYDRALRVHDGILSDQTGRISCLGTLFRSIFRIFLSCAPGGHRIR